MWRLALFLAVVGIAQCSCPKGFDLVAGGQCRGFLGKFNLPFEQAAPTAIEKCAGVQAQAVIIHNQEQQSYWAGKAPATTDGFLVLGLVCNSKSKKWEWSDGSALDYKPPTNLRNPELDKSCSPDFTWDIHPDGYWSYGGAGNYIQALIWCTSDLPPLPKTTEGCENFGQDAGNGQCYQVGHTAASWQDAENICKQAGAHLASIHNKDENAFLRRMAVANGAVSGIFLGASARDDQPFTWVDGTNMDYEPYAPGFPKPNLGYCVAMDTSSSNGQWMNVDCKAKLPFACRRKQRNDVEQPFCENEEWKENTVITSPGFPSSAATPCDYLLSVASGKRVSVEIQLEANSCCDSLILYDGYIGGSVIAKLTGDLHNATYTTKSSNVMKVSWAPKGGVNVKGLAMTFRAV